ncbi:MAG TPA: hypothetical protein VLE73_06970 [Candidatus Saccharimonadales bacterium]|nr:hypothetical protein [Candidatus Saccharimonadales bacterium]
MTVEYTADALQRTFDHLLADEERITALSTALATSVLSKSIEPTGEKPYRRLQRAALDQISAAALATEAPGNQGVWGRIEIEDNAPAGVWKTLEMLQVVEDIYGQYATVPQQADVVAASLDRTTRHMVGFARMGRNTIGSNSLAQSQGIDPQDPAAPVVRRVLMGGVSMSSITPSMYEARKADDGQITVLPRFRNVHTNPQEGHCGAADTLVMWQNRPRPAPYTFLRTIGSVAAATIYSRSFVIKE